MKVSGLFSQVCHEILTDRTLLPSLPDIALRVRSALEDPDYDVDSIARIVQTDPGVSAHLIAMANSPFYLTRIPAESIKSAIQRIGIEGTRNFVMIYTLRALFQSRSKQLIALMRELWKQSTELAAVSAVLAATKGVFDPDRAMLAGLLQNIGALPLLRRFEQRELQADTGELRAVVDELSAKVGVVLLKHWNFDEDMIDVVRSRNDWHRDKQPDADLADIVLIARLHNRSSDLESGAPLPMNEVPAFAKLGLGELTPNLQLDILIEAKTKILQVQQMLGG